MLQIVFSVSLESSRQGRGAMGFASITFGLVVGAKKFLNIE
jgi:hypothetical protein